MSGGTRPFILTLAIGAATVLALLRAAPARAEIPPVPVTVGTLNPTPDVPHVWSATPVKFDLVVTAPAGAKLNLRADLLQVAAGGLAAPLLHDLTVTDALEFEARDHGRRLVEFTLTAAPVVQRSARFLLRFRVQTVGEGEWHPAGTVTLFVHPDERAEWKKRLAQGLQSRGWRLAVFGANATLRRFLRERGVSFEDAGAEKPHELDPKRLYLGESAAPKAPDPSLAAALPATSPAKLILLSPASADAALPPGVYSSRNAAGGILIKVTLPLLDRLADDPASQRLLAEVLRQALEPPAPTTPVPDADPNPSP